MKCTSREQALRRYGPIDLASAHWSGQSVWLIMMSIPQGMFPNWHILNYKIPVTHFACNSDVQAPLMKALQAVKSNGFEKELKTFDGCFNIRAVRGSDLVSTHSYGLALDLNASIEPLGSHTTHWSEGFRKCFLDVGFEWGGNFTGRKDPMHFSYAWEGHH